MRLTTTLNRLRKEGACTSGYKTLRAALGADYPLDQPIDLLTILDSNGLDDALWALRATEQDCQKIARLMAADFAEQALPIWEEKYPEDKRPALAIKAARDFANGQITAAAAAAARAAARAAVWAAGAAAGEAAGAAAAARAAAVAASEAAEAAREAAGAAVWAVVWAAGAAGEAAAAAAAREAAGAAGAAGAAQAATEKQRQIFISYIQKEK